MNLRDRFNLFAAFRDLRDFMRARERHEWIAAVAAILITGWVLYAFDVDSYMERAPNIVYVENWPTTRTDAQIKKDIKADSDARHAYEAERRRQFQQLADQLGIDTSK